MCTVSAFMKNIYAFSHLREAIYIEMERGNETHLQSIKSGREPPQQGAVSKASPERHPRIECRPPCALHWKIESGCKPGLSDRPSSEPEGASCRAIEKAEYCMNSSTPPFPFQGCGSCGIIPPWSIGRYWPDISSRRSSSPETQSPGRVCRYGP